MYDKSAMALLNDVCERIGVEPKNVREVRITPKSIVVEVFMLSARGHKFITPSGEVALEEHELSFTPSF